MFITKKSLPRRTFLRGVGASLALPLLDSMIPARTLLAQTAAKPVSRLGFVYVPHGAIMDKWTPAAVGSGFEFTPILKPLEPFRDRLNVVSGLGHRAADTTAVHSLSPTTWLSGVRPKATQGVDAFAGVTADQVAAQAIGQETPLPSMELATEDHSGLIGSCDRDYGCIYMNTLSWRTPETPLPMEINPRKVFERMFGQGGSAAERVARIQEDRSILDAITREVSSLQLQLGPSDRQTMTQYLENVREIERRIQRAEKSQGDEDLQLPARPAGVPFDFEEHVALMYELMALSYQANITRVITFMVSREVSNRTYTQVGVTDGHHAISHHQNRAEKMEKNVRIQTFNINQFKGFLDKLQAMPDGDGTLLDHTLLLYGSNMSNSNAHDHYPLPNILVGGAAGTDEGRPSPEVPRSHADDQSARDDARQGWREAGEARGQLGDSRELVGSGIGIRIGDRDQDVGAAFRRPGSDMRILLSTLSLTLLVASTAFAAETTGAKDLRLVEAAKSRNAATAIALLQKKIDPNTPEPDGTTALHWAVRYDEVALVERLIKAGAKVNAANRYGVTPIALACESASAARRRAPAQGGREPECHQPAGRDGAPYLRAHRQRRSREGAPRARRGGEHRRQLARTDAADVGGRAGTSGDGARARRGRRRRQRAIDGRHLGAAAQRRAARQVAAAGRLHGPAARGPRRVRGLREGARLLGRQHQRDRPREPHRARAGADERPIRRGRRADRGRHRRQPRRQRRPHGALRRGGRAYDARVEPAGAEGRGLHAHQHGDHPEAAGARRQRECAAARGDSLSHEARSRR